MCGVLPGVAPNAIIAINQVLCSIASETSDTRYTSYATYHDSAVAGFGQRSVSLSLAASDACSASEAFLGSAQSACATEDIGGWGVYASPSVTYDWAENP
jgi:hypothetical protein